MGAIGAEIVIKCVDKTGASIDISSATALKIHIKRPDDTTLDKTSTLKGDGTDGEMRYATADATDFNVPGEYEAQGLFDDGTYDGPSERVKFQVFSNVI